MNKLYFMLVIMGIMLLSLAMVSAGTAIDAIKTFDSVVPKILNATQFNSSQNWFGGVGSNNTLRQTYDMSNNIAWGLMWRYNHNLTTELGYPDPYYNNLTIKRYALSMGKYLADVYDLNDSYPYSWNEGFVINAFILADYANFYQEANSSIPNLTIAGDIDSTWTNSSSNHVYYANPERWVNQTSSGVGWIAGNSSTISSHFVIQGQQGNNYFDLDNNSLLDMDLSVCVTYNDSHGGVTPAKLQALKLDGTTYYDVILFADANNSQIKTTCGTFNHTITKMTNHGTTDERITTRWTGNLNYDTRNTIYIYNASISTPATQNYPRGADYQLDMKQYALRVMNTSGSNFIALWDADTNYWIANQKSAALAALMSWNKIFKDAYQFNVTTFDNSSLNGMYNVTAYVETEYNTWIIHPDGIPKEWNEEMTNRLFGGYDSNYLVASTAYWSLIHNYSSNSTFKAQICSDLNRTMNNFQYLILPTQASGFQQIGLGSRVTDGQNTLIGTYNSTSGNFTSEVLPYGLFSIVYAAKCGSGSQKLNYFLNNNWSAIDDSWHSVGYAGQTEGWLIHAYKFWDSQNVSSAPMPNQDGVSHLLNLNNTGLTFVERGKYLAWISYGGASPSGGIISDILNKNTWTHLFSGRSVNKVGYGIGKLINNEDLIINETFFTQFGDKEADIDSATVYHAYVALEERWINGSNFEEPNTTNSYMYLVFDNANIWDADSNNQSDYDFNVTIVYNDTSKVQQLDILYANDTDSTGYYRNISAFANLNDSQIKTVSFILNTSYNLSFKEHGAGLGFRRYDMRFGGGGVDGDHFIQIYNLSVSMIGNSTLYKDTGATEPDYNNVFAGVTTTSEILSDTYPYKIRYSGNFTKDTSSGNGNNNKIHISDDTFITEYTFYDNYIEVNQTTSIPSLLELYPISIATIGTDQIKGVEARGSNKLDGSTIIPLNFIMDYSDGYNNASWGMVDKFNSSGNSYNYIIQTSDTGGFLEVFGDSFLINNTEGLDNKNVPIFNLTSALLTNGTSLCNGSTGLMTGNVNITLNPNEFCYVLDNFNLTEGINRQYSPIWFSSSSSTSRIISNNLTNAVTITTYINHSLPNRIYTYNESLIEYHSFGNESFNNDSGLIEINLTIYPGNNTINFDCIEPFNNINILENLSTCVNKSYSITNLYISNNSIFTINEANLTVDRIEKISGKLIKNTGRLIII